MVASGVGLERRDRGNVAHGIANGIAGLALQQAIANVEDAIEMAAHVQAQGKSAVVEGLAGPDFGAAEPAVGAEAVLHLVAVVKALRRRQHGQQRWLGEPADALQQVAHLGVLFGELLFVMQMLQGAAAAVGEMLAFRFGVVRRLLQYLQQARQGMALALTHDPRPHPLPGQGVAHEDHEAIDPGHALGAEVQRLDLQFDFCAFFEAHIAHSLIRQNKFLN